MIPKTIYLAIYFSFFSSSDSSRSYTHLEPQTLSSVSFPRQNWSGWCFRLDRVSGHLTILRGRGEEDMEHCTDPVEVKGSSWGESILCEQESYSFGKKKKAPISILQFHLEILANENFSTTVCLTFVYYLFYGKTLSV